MPRVIYWLPIFVFITESNIFQCNNSNYILTFTKKSYHWPSLVLSLIIISLLFVWFCSYKIYQSNATTTVTVKIGCTSCSCYILQYYIYYTSRCCRIKCICLLAFRSALPRVPMYTKGLNSYDDPFYCLQFRFRTFTSAHFTIRVYLYQSWSIQYNYIYYI